MGSNEVDALLQRQQGMATRRQLRDAGLTRRALERSLRDGALLRLSPGFYGSGQLPARGKHLLSSGQLDSGYLAQVRRVLMTVGGDAAASRRTAALMWGFDLAVEPSGVEIDVEPARSRLAQPGLDARRRVLHDIVEEPVSGLALLRLTSPLRTVVDCAEVLPLREAVTVTDSALRSGRVCLPDLARAVAERRSTGSAEQARRVVRWADPRCGSVLESLLRVLLLQQGLLAPETQYVVRSSAGLFVGRVDFCWPGARLIVEADGHRWHDPEDARDRDRRRSNEFGRLGWTLLRFTWADVVHAPDWVVATVRDCLARAAA